MKQSNHPICPKCVAIIPDEAPGGLCPLCALEGAASVTNTMSGGRHITPPDIEEIAPHFPDLEILEILGIGGMGAVYKARQPQLDRFVALKILSHNLASDPVFVERFNREARVLGRLNHPNIVGIHDFGTAGPYCYLLMEYVDGVNLRQAMRAGRFTPTEALEMVQHLCSALKFAHEEGVLHRDIKPENILIDSKGRIKVADFGIAKLVGEDRQHDYTLTIQGSILGSPHYMAPEQIETPGDVDQRADIYSLGVVFYELLTGGLPIGRFALPSEKASMDARIDHIVMRTLEKEREARYQSAGEVGTEVEAVTKHPAPATTKVAAVHGEPGAARFSLTAAILTGISFPLAIILGFVPYMFLSLKVTQPSGAVEQQGFAISAGMILAGLGMLVALGCAVIGFILGAIALGKIRRSGGIKTGVGSAIFATTAWPILFLFFLALVPLQIRMPLLGDGPHLGPFLLIFAVLLPVLAASWVLVRALYRWAKGAERKDGTRFHPGLGIPLLMVILLTIGGPLLLAVTARLILPAGERRDPQAEKRRVMMKEETRKTSVDSDPSESEPVDWHHGLPEVKIPLSVNPGLKVEFRLIRSFTRDVAEENRLQTIELDEIACPVGRGPNGTQGIPPYKTHLFLGTTAPRKDGAGLTAVCQWERNHKFDIDMDFRDWQFATQLPDELVISEVGVSKYVIATKDTGNSETAEQLVLRAVVTEAYD